MPTNYQTHVKTVIPVKLGFSNLYEPRAFKPKTEKADDKASAPRYSTSVLMDKKKDAKNITRFDAAQNAAIQRSLDRKSWSKRMVDSATLAFRDCDDYETSVTVGTEDVVMTLAEQNPNKKGKYELRASSKANARPQVYYMDEKGVIKPMPKPILDPDPNDPKQLAEADRIHVFWDEHVYAGQNAMIAVSFYTFTKPFAGIKANLDWVLIVGGGTPEGQVEFKDDFNEDDASALLAWRNANTATDAGFDFGDEFAKTDEEDTTSDVDEETGEIVEDEPKPARRKRTVEADEDSDEVPAAPRRRKAQPDEVIDDGEEEETPAPRRRKTKPVVIDTDEDEEPAPRKRRTRRPVVEEDDEYAEPDTF